MLKRPRRPQDASKTRFWRIWGAKSEASWHQYRILKRFYAEIVWKLKITIFPMEFNEFIRFGSRKHWWTHWFFIDVHWFSLIFRWISMMFHWCSLIFHWFSMIPNDFSLIFMRPGAPRATVPPPLPHRCPTLALEPTVRNPLGFRTNRSGRPCAPPLPHRGASTTPPRRLQDAILEDLGSQIRSKLAPKSYPEEILCWNSLTTKNYYFSYGI